MHRNPAISIIMITRNRAGTIARAIDSVLYQTFMDWELLIVDDGSTDETREILAKYCSMDRRIRCIFLPHVGICAARYTGTIGSLGKTVTFLDSYDMYKKNLPSNGQEKG